jgi:uncharacterized alkaline shock family protein YloU
MTQAVSRTDTTTDKPAQVGRDEAVTGAAVAATRDRLTTGDGRISVAQRVVQKIAGIACFGAIRERIPGSVGPNVAQGVGVEVGETQAAVDLDIVVEYGVSIAELGRSIQRNVKTSIERMTGLEVVEVNINVDDVHLPGAESGEAPSPSRVS